MMAKEFLKTHDQEFQYRPKPTLAAEILMGNKGMVTTGGPLSQHLRRICFTELFATKHLQSFESMRTKEINNTINDIHMESEEGKVVDLKSRVSSLGINILTHMMFRKRYFGMDESKQNEIHCFKEEMLAGGAETSSLTIEWAMAELIRNPMIMRRAQMELETVVGMNRIIEESDLHKLTYLRAVIKETFRLHPPAPLLVPHSSTSKICGIAKGYDIPPHARVMVNVWAMGRDPSIWERPFEFCPERFLQQGQEHHHIAAEIIDMDEKNFKLFPFGSGRRACPGRPLGILVVQIVLARLLHSFHWVLPNHQEPNTLDMSEEFGLTLPRAQQLHLKAYPKLQAHLYK